MTAISERRRPASEVPHVGMDHMLLMRATAAVAGLLAVAASSGLFLDVYRHETVFARNGYRGSDLVSLALVGPLLAWARWNWRRRSTGRELLWLGGLGYVAYQYGYTFAYRWNRLFLVYLALLMLAGYTLVSALVHLDASAVAARFDETTPVRATARLLASIGAGLAVIELGQIVPAIISGDAPQLVTDTGHPTSPVYILDLGLVVPLMLLTARWLRARRPWAYVAAAILLVKGITVGLGLLAANLFAVVNGDTNDGPLNLLWAAIAAGSAITLWRYLRHVHDVSATRDHRVVAAGAGAFAEGLGKQRREA